jgi:pyrroline-5-carboxylate reductase
MNSELSIAFIGGGNMAAALTAGLVGPVCPAARIHVIDLNDESRRKFEALGMSTAAAPDDKLAQCSVWIYAVKPQNMKEVVLATQPFMRDSLVISIAAGIRAGDLARWLGKDGTPWGRVVRCMPNTPSLIGAGATGLAALPGVSDADRELAGTILGAVGSTTWVDDESLLDAVTALSGSGPAYVFLFIESLIAGGLAVGLNQQQARDLALATLSGATRLAAESSEPPSVLRERVTSKGGTTKAALDVFEAAGFRDTVAQAMQAAARRAHEMGEEFGNA